MDYKEKLQIAIEVLVDVHENETKDMARFLGMGYHNECKGHVANTVRYLMSKRDETTDNEKDESLRG